MTGPFSPDQLGLEDGDVVEAEEVYEEDEEQEEEGFCPCGCAGGTLPGTAGMGGSVCSLTR